MPQETLKQQLQQLHDALQQHPQLDDESQQLLKTIADDIAGQSGAAQPDEDLTEQVQQQAIRFEQEYPTLSGILRQIVDTLGRIGV
ncbi:DUF4404 family protein [Bacterioplanoides sp.]|uniref:DUF4404 family protein n=1 Tax=Bacterioplanoides sp. TaxID=2066072 RepID=UPI003B594680